MFKIISCMLLAALVCFSCKKEVGVAGPVGPQGPGGPAGVNHDTASISGSLSLFNALSWPLADFDGVTVTLKSGTLQQSTSTDASGNYIFYGLEKGTYDLSYSKTGFGTMKAFGIAHSPGGPLPTVVPAVYLLQEPAGTAVQTLTGTDSPPTIEIHFSLDTSSLDYTPYPGNMVLLIGKTAGLSLSNYLVMQSADIGTDGAGGYVYFIDRSSLDGLFSAGDNLYVTVCTYNRYVHKLKDPNAWYDLGSSAAYVDPGSGDYVYPNLSMAPAALHFTY